MQQTFWSTTYQILQGIWVEQVEAVVKLQEQVGPLAANQVAKGELVNKVVPTVLEV